MKITGIIGILTLIALSSIARAQSERQVYRARQILNSKPTGQIANSFIQDNNVVIKALSLSEMRERGLAAKGGGIQIPEYGEDGDLVIIVNSDLDTFDMAHAIAHEAKHLEQVLKFRDLFQQFPELKESQDRADQALLSGDPDRIREHNVEIYLAVVEVFLAEYEAHRVGFQLEDEGLPKSDELGVSRANAVSEIREYIKSVTGLNLEDHADSYAQAYDVIRDLKDMVMRLRGLGDYSQTRRGAIQGPGNGSRTRRGVIGSGGARN